MKYIKWIILPLSLLILILFATYLLLPTILLPKIEAYVNEGCKHCNLKIATMTILPAAVVQIELNDVRFKYTPNDHVYATIDKIRLSIPFTTFYKTPYIIDDIEFINPNVLYTDGDKKTTSTIEKTKLPLFILHRSSIKNGKFEYVRNTKGTSASFNIYIIDATLSKLGNTPELIKEATQLVANGRVENSGETHLNVTTFLWNENAFVTTVLKVKDQNLEDLNFFLKANAGVNLHGKMLQGTATLEVREQNLITNLMATYQGFKIDFDPMYDRNEFTTFFMNLGSSIITKSQNKAKGDPKDEYVQLTREPNEPIVGFMLRGLKEAAIKLSIAQPIL